MKIEILKVLEDKDFNQRTIEQLASYFHLETGDEFKELIKVLNELEDAYEIVRNKHNQYYLPVQLGMVIGKLQVTKQGFGFVSVENQDKDIYINQRNLKDAYHNDIVLVALSTKLDVLKPEGVIKSVIERGTKQVVGTIKKAKREYYVVADDQKFTKYVYVDDDQKFTKYVYVDDAHLHGATIGHKVLVEIKAYKPYLKGNVLEILGHELDPGVDILSIVYDNGAVDKFSRELFKSLDNLKYEIDSNDLKDRLDLRDKQIVTIDGDDAKDLDDAISLEINNNGNYLLGVHIADVSYYVEEGSLLDQEAYQRGTSIYLVDRVIPMLPHALSNGICSLNEGVDRLTISCIMEINHEGVVLNYEIKPSVINSNHRMTYRNVNEILDGNLNVIEEYQDCIDLFYRMDALAKILNNKRYKDGAIDFDTKEAKVLVDKSGKPYDVVLRTRGQSEKIIEEFMLQANTVIASNFKWLDLPFIYRVHEQPSLKKLQSFVNVAKNFGYTIHGSLEDVYPSQLQAILEKAKGQVEQPIISTLLLRSMQKARYCEECLGHFGLANDFYTHFTSPIRRYPDLLVHRLIRKYLFEKDTSLATINRYQYLIPEIALNTSNAERRAITIERAVDDMKMAEYMGDRVGQEFEGIISSVTSFGFFVELPNTIEGLVRVESLTDDYYNFIEGNLMFKGQRTGRIFKMSDLVKVRVIGASKSDRTIDFEIVGMVKSNPRYKKTTSSKRYTKKRKKVKHHENHYK